MGQTPVKAYCAAPQNRGVQGWILPVAQYCNNFSDDFVIL
jgi:hypothetical protein